jgi:hypothetical protein
MRKEWLIRMLRKPRKQRAFATNGLRPTMKQQHIWRYRVKEVGIIWIIALALSWLMGLGVLKLIKIIDALLYQIG